MFCTNCGKEIEGNVRFCPECGALVVKATEKADDRSGEKAYRQNQELAAEEIWVC